MYLKVVVSTVVDMCLGMQFTEIFFFHIKDTLHTSQQKGARNDDYSCLNHQLLECLLQLHIETN